MNLVVFALLTLAVALGISYFVAKASTKPSVAVDSNMAKDDSKTDTGLKSQALSAQDDTEIVDRRLPPAKTKCLNCSKDVKDLGKPLLRCSQCKNAFYCSEVCQKAEWKRHKLNCSVFPPEGILPARIPVTKSLVDEVNRVDLMMRDWLNKFTELTNGLKDNIDKVNGAGLLEAIPICQLQLSPEFAFNKLPAGQLVQHPFRNSLIQISRLYLITLIATHPNPEHRLLLSSKIEQISSNLPPHLSSLYGPKIVNRPADLSPGEYDTFAEIAPILMEKPEEIGMQDGEQARWIALAVALKKMWNATLVPKEPQTQTQAQAQIGQ